MAHEIDFADEETQAQLSMSQYPPRFIVNVNGERACRNYCAMLSCSGIQRDLKVEVSLYCPTLCRVESTCYSTLNVQIPSI